MTERIITVTRPYASLINVIKVCSNCGSGTDYDPYRLVTQFFLEDGNLIGEIDEAHRKHIRSVLPNAYFPTLEITEAGNIFLNGKELKSVTRYSLSETGGGIAAFESSMDVNLAGFCNGVGLSEYMASDELKKGRE